LRRITKAALGGLAGCALVLGGTQAASSASLLKEVFSGNLVDLDADNVALPPPGSDGLPMTGAFDSAQASLKLTVSGGTTTFAVHVKGIDPDYAGQRFGSHLHTKKCVENFPGDAGPHYQHTQDPDLTTLAEKEVWLEFVPNEEGVAVDRTVVPFVPEDEDGVMSIVIHETFTNPTTGGAGDREVCLPLDVTSWGPDIVPSPVSPTP